jgi:hypothetical protein
MGKLLFFVGVGVATLGLLVIGAERMGLRLGRLPGDISIERSGFSLSIPLSTMLLLSLILSGFLTLVGWLRR